HEQRVSGDLDNDYTYTSRALLKTYKRGSEQVSYGYRADSDLLASVTSTSDTVSYDYDPVLSRLSTVTLAGAAASQKALTWEPGGARLTSAIDADLADFRCYDDRGRVRTIAHAGSMLATPCEQGPPALFERIDYEYDERDNRTRQVLTDAFAV